MSCRIYIGSNPNKPGESESAKSIDFLLQWISAKKDRRLVRAGFRVSRARRLTNGGSLVIRLPFHTWASNEHNGKNRNVDAAAHRDL